MDPLSAASSLIAVVQISGSIVSLCYDYRRAAKGAKNDIVRLVSEVQSLRNVVERQLRLLDRPEVVRNGSLAEKKHISVNDDRFFDDDDADTIFDAEDSQHALPALQQLASGDDSPLTQCLVELERLEERLRPPVQIWRQQEKGQNKVKARLLGAMTVLLWPLQEKEVTLALGGIARLRGIIELALATDTAAAVLDIRQATSELSFRVAGVHETQMAQAAEEDARRSAEAAQRRKGRARKQRQVLAQWLKPPPNLAAKHKDISSRQAANTTRWLLDSDTFAAWADPAQTPPMSALWLHGIPGCGKTVLASAVIESLKHNITAHQPLSALAYFYFDFGDAAMSLAEKMLRSLLVQLMADSRPLPLPVTAFAKRHLIKFQDLFDDKAATADVVIGSPEQVEISSQPKVDEILDVLFSVLDDSAWRGEHTYLVLDALDECVDQEELLSVLDKLISWRPSPQATGTLRIFLTSRRSHDISNLLETQTTVFTAGTAEVGTDIDSFVREQLATHPRLRRWPAGLRDEILASLTSGAQGMFRWVDCQLGMLQKCVTIRDVRRALSALPKSLSETYARTLKNVDEYHRSYAIRILLWLAVSPTPLEIHAAADVLAVDLDEAPGERSSTYIFDEDLRVPDINDIPAMCTTLVRTIAKPDPEGTGKDTMELHLAHYTVKEYLLSGPFFAGFLGHDDLLPSSLLSITSTALIHAHVASTLVCYLLCLRDPLTQAALQNRPLARHAAQYWPYHFLHSGANDEGRSKKELEPLINMVMELMGVTAQARRADSSGNKRPPEMTECYKNWCRLFDRSKPWRPPNLEREHFTGPLYYASSEGLQETVRLLLEAGADPSTGGDVHGSCLQVASFHGHTAVIRTLLESGADANETGGIYGTPLLAAVTAGHADVVDALLRHGANPNWRHFGPDGSVLIQACRFNRLDIVKLAVAAGANPDRSHTKAYGSTPLSISAWLGHVECVSFLLPITSEQVIYVGFHTAFKEPDKTAARLGEKTTRSVLAEFSRYIPEAVASCASKLGYMDMVDEEPGSGVVGPLPEQPTRGAALGIVEVCNKGQVETAKLMIANGVANVREPLVAANGVKTYPLYHAVMAGNAELVGLFLDKGADANAGHSVYGPPLPFAVKHGDMETVRLLVERGHASVTDANSIRGCPLHIATCAGDLPMVEYLISAGADVNQVASRLKIGKGQLLRGLAGSPLAGAIHYSRTAVVRCLLAHGADPNLETPAYNRQRAGDDDMGTFDDHQPETPLGIAAWEACPGIVDLLLAAGARIEEDGKTRVPRNILYWGIKGGSVGVVRRLLEAGADANATGTIHGTELSVLAAACAEVGACPESTEPQSDEMLRDDAVDIVKALLDAGANPNRCSRLDGYVEPPMQTLVRYGGPNEASIVAVVRELVTRRGVDVNAAAGGGEGWTALHQAARHGRVATVTVLLRELGADPDHQLVNGSRAVHAAAHRNQPGCLAALLQSRPQDIDARNDSGRTPLHWAANGGAAQAVEWLLAHGADTTMEEYGTGMTARDYAVLRLGQCQQQATAGHSEEGAGDHEWIEGESNGSVDNRRAVLELFKRYETMVKVGSIMRRCAD